MGNTVRVFNKEELKGLSEEDKSILKAHVHHLIQTSPEIRQIFDSDLTAVTSHPGIRSVLRREAGALHERLTKK